MDINRFYDRVITTTDNPVLNTNKAVSSERHWPSQILSDSVCLNIFSVDKNHIWQFQKGRIPWWPSRYDCTFNSVIFKLILWINSLRPSDAIWRQWSWTTLAQVMACCLTAPSHYLNQCWLITRGVLWHTSESSFAGIAQGIDSGYEFEKDILKNIFKSPRGQWVNTLNTSFETAHRWMPQNIFDDKA